MKLKLPASVLSPLDLKAVITDVRDYSRWFSHAMVKQRLSAGKLAEPPVISPAAVSVIRDWAGDKPLSQASLDELIEELEAFERTAPTLTIVLAAPAAGSLKQTLTEWCRRNVEPAALVSFQFDSTLLGGLVVRYGSRIFDWSFRRQILAGRGRFPEILRHV